MTGYRSHLRAALQTWNAMLSAAAYHHPEKVAEIIADPPSWVLAVEDELADGASPSNWEDT